MTRADGFTPFLIQMPEPDALCRFHDELTGREWTGYARDIHPLANVAYIWHKLTAIGRMHLHQIPNEQ
jgi:hypothetical protein